MALLCVLEYPVDCGHIPIPDSLPWPFATVLKPVSMAGAASVCAAVYAGASVVGQVLVS